MRLYFVSVLISASVLPFLVNGQSVDELIRQVDKMPEDSSRVLLLNSISTELLSSAPTDAATYSEKSIALAKKINYAKGLGYALKGLGQSYYVQSDYRQAILTFRESLHVFDSIGFKPGQANILSNLGAVYFNGGDDTRALEFYLKSLRLSEEVNDTLRIATALNNIGGVYQNKADNRLASGYFKRALSLFESINYENGVGTVSMNLGEIYMKNEAFDSAYYYLEHSLNVYQGTIDATFPLNLLGKLYASYGDFNKAIEAQDKALKIATTMDAKFEETQVLLGLAETYRTFGNRDHAIELFNQAEKLAVETQSKNELNTAYQALSALYAEKGNYNKAYQYSSLFSSLKDSLYNTTNDKKFQQLQFNFDIEKKQSQIDLLTKDNKIREMIISRQRTMTMAAGVVIVVLLILAFGVVSRSRYIKRTNMIINTEKERYANLLLNILPSETALELQKNGSAAPRFYQSVTVVFTDFRGFSSIAGKLTPQVLIRELNEYFVAFDDIVGRCNLEKIKTMGDAYMCAGGIPTENDTHPYDAVKAAFAMQAYVQKRNEEKVANGLPPWELRIGIHTGPIVAGVVGRKKYAYDIWGDTVNVASRMESNGRAGKVNVSVATYNLIKDRFTCHHRGKIMAKNIGEVDMYFVEGEVDAIRSKTSERVSNA